MSLSAELVFRLSLADPHGKTGLFHGTSWCLASHGHCEGINIYINALNNVVVPACRSFLRSRNEH